jgi:acyl-CoA synthetase (AMP-forming)/AMP-acid ligase II
MEAQALTDVLLAKAERQPEVVAYESIDATGHVSELTHAQLASRASALADQLATGDTGPVLLVYPTGLDYVVAVFASFLAGRPVIPAYPPGASSVPDRDRLAGIIADAAPSVVIAAPGCPDLGVPATLAVPAAESDGGPACRPARAAKPRSGDRPVHLRQYRSARVVSWSGTTA